MTRVAALVLAVLLLAPAAAVARWSSAERVIDPRMPGAAVELEHPSRPGRPLRVWTRRDGTFAVPGSGDAETPVLAEGPGGLVVVAWAVANVCELNASKSAVCNARVMASVFRRGERPPAPRALSEPDTLAVRPAAAIGSDGTVVVAWDRLVDGTFSDTAAVDAALAVGTGPFVTSPVVERDLPRVQGVEVVRGGPQLAVTTESPEGGGTLSFADAAGGRLGPLRVEADLPAGVAATLLLRSPRGDRLLAFEEFDSDLVRVRVGAPGQPLARPFGLRTPGYRAALGAAGDYAVLVHARRDGVSRPFLVLRGRAGSPRRRREVVQPPGTINSGSGVRASLAVDAAGTVYAAWDRRLETAGRGRPAYAVVAAVAVRGGRFTRGSRLSSLGRRGACTRATVTPLRPGRAVARWVCDPAGSARPFTEQARYTADG